MKDTENKEIETAEIKPKRKHLLAEIAQLKELNKKLEDGSAYDGYKIENLKSQIIDLKIEITALRAYVAGVKGDAFPESEDK